MHRVEVNTDRHDRRPDPVAARDGVFEVTRPDELSEAELARLGTVDRMAWEAARAKTQSADNKTQSRWSVAAIAARLTALYARFSKPKGGA